MNDSQIETLLRKAPQPRVPEDLRQRLNADIRLPGVSRERAAPTIVFWPRWFPAVSFGLFVLCSLIALAVQTSQFLELRRENESLRVGTANLDTLHQDNTETQSQNAAAQEADRQRREHEELLRLRDEATQLRAQAAELATLRAENQRLQADRAAAAAKAGAVVEEDPFAAAKDKAQRIACVNNLKQIGLAARIWAADNQDVLPIDFVTMHNELSTPKLLICPSDGARKPAANWQEFNASNVSYLMLSPGVPEADPQVVYVHCPIHNNVALVDGSVQQLGSGWKVLTVDGKAKISPPPSFE